jgi:hypothetical protein
MPLFLFCLVKLHLKLYCTLLEFEVGGYDKMENFLTTIPKQTIEKKTSTTPITTCFKHQILLASIYSQVAISVKVGAAGAFPMVSNT